MKEQEIQELIHSKINNKISYLGEGTSNDYDHFERESKVKRVFNKIIKLSDIENVGEHEETVEDLDVTFFLKGIRGHINFRYDKDTKEADFLVNGWDK